MMRIYFIGLLTAVLAGSGMCDPVPTTINDFFMPGSQPNQSGNIEHPSKCDNCHGGYNTVVEPAFNWRGSMMSQAARDPLYYASLTIANQDAPESGDLCIRCHSPDGWLSGRSTPTDGSALNSGDREGVQCDFCHKLVKPTALGVNPYPGDPDYTADTYPADQDYLATITPIPAHSANGMYIADSDNAKRGPFVDANATHQMFYGPYHAESAICGTCHDVSNPAFSRNADGTYSPNDLDQPAPSFSPYDQFPVERTYSEWLMSAYNTPEGVYAPQFGGNKDTVATCQDCHMRDISGVACNKSSGVYRDDLPYHDMTGGNTFVPLLIEAVFPGESDPGALAAGIDRAMYMLQNAATLEVSAEVSGSTYDLHVRVINETGHKLLSGYPEGRRMWLNVQAYNQTGGLIYESGAYDNATGVLTHDADAKIYEIKPGITEDIAAITGNPVGPSFHFAINSKIYFDNRIPPRGFTNANFNSVQSPPVGYTYEDGQYWDDTEYHLPGATERIIVTLYYQTTSKEYVEFLRDENVTDDRGNIMFALWEANGKSTPVAMNVDTVNVTPLQGNSPPELATIGDKSTDENVNLTFTVTAADPDGTIPDLTATGMPSGASFVDHDNGTGTFDWTPTYEQSGLYSVTFVAVDDSGGTDSEIVDITVNNVNRPPELDTIPEQSVEADSTLMLDVSASDPDGTIPSLTATSLPTGADFVDHNNGTGTFTWTPAADQIGLHQVVFHASDGETADSQRVEIEVISIYLCGDASGDGDINVGDATYIINYVFKGGPAPNPVCIADPNADGDINVADAVYLINYIFKGGPAPLEDCCPW